MSVTRLSEFERLFQSCYEPVFRYAARRVSPDAVQDVVSDTFLVAWRRFDDLHGEPLPWLLGIARGVSANHLRGAQRRLALLERISREPQPEPSQLRDDVLLSALAGLSEVDREALLLVSWEGLSNRDAARVVGCTTTAFAVRLHRARRRLRQELRHSAEPLVGSVNDIRVTHEA